MRGHPRQQLAAVRQNVAILDLLLVADMLVVFSAITFQLRQVLEPRVFRHLAALAAAAFPTAGATALKPIRVKVPVDQAGQKPKVFRHPGKYFKEQHYTIRKVDVLAYIFVEKKSG